jgi:hypothetical protein
MPNRVLINIPHSTTVKPSICIFVPPRYRGTLAANAVRSLSHSIIAVD